MVYRVPISWAQRLALKLTSLAVVLCVANAATETVKAAPVLTTPAGLAPGDTFRFVFVTTGTHDGGSADLADYDAFVNTQADGATYNGSTVSWQVIGSTQAPGAIITHAKDHIGFNPTLSGVFLVDGTQVATGDGPTGLWSGGILSPLNLDIHGTEMFGLAFTGTRYYGSGALNNELGQFAPRLGSIADTGQAWVDGPGNDYFYYEYKMYGISQVLTAVPEPASLALLAMGVVMLRRRARVM